MWIKNLGQVYCILVCLVASMVMMFSAIQIASITMEYIFPEIMNATKMSNFVSNEAFLRSESENQGEAGKERLAELKSLSSEDLSTKREMEHTETRMSMKTMSFANILRMMPVFFIAFLFFIFHWSFYRRTERRERAPSFQRPIRPRKN